MLGYKIAYNPFNKNYISGNASHTIQLHNKGKQKSFNDYVRGVIINKTLHLRLYYPFDDIDNISKDKLYQSSYTLLKENVDIIIALIKKHDNISIKDIKYNVDNDLLKGLNLINV